MSVTTTTSGGNTSIIFTYKATTAQFLRIADQIAKYLHSVDLTQTKPYAQLTNAEKLDLLDRFVLQSLMNARLLQSVVEGDAARQAVIDAVGVEPPLTIR